MDRVLFLILAGGRGKRLRPLTNSVPKPLVRFSSSGAIIDFTLNNCLAHKKGNVQVLTQFQGSKIKRYIDTYWKQAFRSQGRKLSYLHGKGTTTEQFRGTADAVYKALRTRKSLTKFVMVLASDHIYQMDYESIIRFHEEHGDPATVGCVECTHEQSHRFGIIKAGMDGKIDRIYEKPPSLAGIVPTHQKPLASMGIYVFSGELLLDYLSQNQLAESHDLGKDILPQMAVNSNVWAFPFIRPDGSSAYWRDVGDLSAYLEANIEQISGADNLTNFNFISGIQNVPTLKDRSIRCHQYGHRKIINSQIAETARVRDALIENSVICSHAVIEDGAIVRRSIVLDGAVIHRFAEVVDAVVEANGHIRRDQPNLGVFHPGLSSPTQAHP